MRLADRVRIEYPDVLGDAPIIVADEVAAQIDQLPGDTWSFTPSPEDYGVVAPPFTRFFVEAQTAVNLEDIGSFGRQVIQRGVLIETQDSKPPDCRWVYMMTPYIWYQSVPGAVIAGTHTVNGRIVLHLAATGRILDDLEAVTTMVYDRDPLTADKMRSFVSFLPFALKALSVLHQRTVVKQVTHTRQQRRRHEREHGRKLADYYWLTVQPAPDVRTMSDVARPVSPRHNREHMVRGHFRYYTPERPLFGRYSGMVWIPEHQRGDPNEGSVNKDYLIGG